MLKKLLILTVLVFISVAATFAQTIEGTVKDAKTGAALEYVNVGIPGKNIGTVTDNSGHFQLPINNNSSDSLKISMIGYISKTFKVSDYIPGKTILLDINSRELTEVKIFSKKPKMAVLGNTTRSQSTDAGFTSNELGNEIGAVIKIKRAPTHLLQFNTSLAHPATDSVKLRLNFYTVTDGLPDKIIQDQNIFITVKKGQDNISVDLTPYHIVVQDKFFVSLEWIENAKGSGLMFSASLLSSAIIARETSQANWEKMAIAGVGFNVLAEY